MGKNKLSFYFFLSEGSNPQCVCYAAGPGNRKYKQGNICYVCISMANDIKIILKLHTTLDFLVSQLKPLGIVNALIHKIYFLCMYKHYTYSLVVVSRELISIRYNYALISTNRISLGNN